jgi:hypothetical protein
MASRSSRTPGAGQRTPEEIKLTNELNDLYRARDYPSRRDLSREIPGGFGASTIGDALNGLGLPSWDVFEALVAHLDGDTAHFLGLYQSARVARTAARNSTAALALILICSADRHPAGGVVPMAITVRRGDALCADCVETAGG